MTASPSPSAISSLDYDGTLILVHCPACGDVASVEWRRSIAGTTYLKVRCIQRHWFLLPADQVSRYV